MEEILEINGIKYIKQEKVKQQQEELKKLKATLSKVLGELSEYVEHDVIVPQEIEPKTTKRNANRPSRYNRKNEPFKVNESGKQRWNIFKMDNEGNFINAKGQKFRVTIREVLIVKNAFTKTITQKEAHEIQERTGLNYPTFHRLVYNVEEKVFDKYIKQWNQITQPKFEKKPVEYQNNPQKRKEMGLC